MKVWKALYKKPSSKLRVQGAVFLGKSKNGFLSSDQWILQRQKNAKSEKGLFSMTPQTKNQELSANFKNKNKK